MKTWLSFTEAREFVCKLNLKGYEEWIIYCKSGNKPDNIPNTPRTVYEKKWKGLGDWLGTGRIASRDKEFLSFLEARKFALRLELTNQKEWNAYCKSGNKPSNIPTNPRVYYKDEWKGLGDWLGTDTIGYQRHRKFLSFLEAREFIYKLNLNGKKGWYYYCKSGNKPSNIPSNPDVLYEKFFISWGDWLGTGRIANRNKEFLSFVEAREFVHKKNITNQKEWNAYCNTGNKPTNIPRNPGRTYKDEFKGFGDWLGTGKIATKQCKEWQTFEESRTHVHSMKLANYKEWITYCNSGNKPTNIPAYPEGVYKNEFKGYGDWLGTGRVSRKEKQQKFASIIKSIEESLPSLPMVAWWHILLQNGIAPTNNHVKSLKAFQNGKLSLKDLMKGKEAEDDNALSTPTQTQTSTQILRLLDNPLVSNLDETAIAAIMAEVESQIWEKIYLNEKEEINSLQKG